MRHDVLYFSLLMFVVSDYLNSRTEAELRVEEDHRRLIFLGQLRFRVLYPRKRNKTPVGKLKISSRHAALFTNLD